MGVWECVVCVVCMVGGMVSALHNIYLVAVYSSRLSIPYYSLLIDILFY
jgi:hypothetical protein